MSHEPLPQDVESAREDGRRFGHAIGQQTASAMTQARGDTVELGKSGVAQVLARANALADAGLSRALAEEWTEAAATAFNEELGRAAALLQSGGTRH